MAKYTPQSGIYVISNSKNGKIYIGQAQDMPTRWGQHKRSLKNGKHGNRHLQAAYDKYGEKLFKFRVLEYCTVDQLDTREQHYLDIYMPKGICYNLAPEAGTTRGKPCNDETKRKISMAHKGKSLDKETREKISNSLKGRQLNDNQHKAIIESNKNRVVSDNVLRNLSEVHKRKKGVKHTPEHALKISEALKGHKHSDETRQKISESAKKRHQRDRQARDE